VRLAPPLLALFVLACGPLRILPPADPQAERRPVARDPYASKPVVQVFPLGESPADAVVPERQPARRPTAQSGRQVLKPAGGPDLVPPLARSEPLSPALPSSPGAAGSAEPMPNLTAPTGAQMAALVEAGRHSYGRYCASCHGVSARGDGPAGPALIYPPSDLTRIAERRGGVFVHADIAAHIDGRIEHPAHGTRQEPVWGKALDLTRDAELAALLLYLQSLQVELVQPGTG
jgi:mono/diheme cytochrome c family protein